MMDDKFLDDAFLMDQDDCLVDSVTSRRTHRDFTQKMKPHEARSRVEDLLLLRQLARMNSEVYEY